MQKKFILNRVNIKEEVKDGVTVTTKTFQYDYAADPGIQLKVKGEVLAKEFGLPINANDSFFVDVISKNEQSKLGEKP